MAIVSCASAPQTAPASPEEIAAAEAEVQAAQEKLDVAIEEAKKAAETAAADQSSENINAFYEKREAWETATKELNQAKAKLKKLRP